MPYFDGHLHSTASDGTLAPAAVVDVVRRAGTRVFALTDHDTFAGHPAAAARAAELGLDFVPGVEMSVDFAGRELHVLAYFVSSDAVDLASALDQARAGRRGHLGRMLARLAELGCPLAEADVLAHVPPSPATGEMPSIGRPHVARALVRKGYVRTFDEAFDRFLGEGKPGHVRRPLATAADMIALASAAGGVCSVAHPGVHDLDETTLGQLAALGVVGVEVYHPEHAQDDVVHYLRACARLGLVPTGGSDHHGPPHSPPHAHSPGLDRAAYERLLHIRPSRRPST